MVYTIAINLFFGPIYRYKTKIIIWGGRENNVDDQNIGDVVKEE